MSRARLFLAAYAAMLLATGCEDATPVDDGVRVDVRAELAVVGDAADRLVGTITLDLSLPDGVEARPVVLSSLVLGEHALSTSELRGLEAFPDTMRGGDRVTVTLEVDAATADVGGSWFEPACAAPGTDVVATIVDGAAAASGAPDPSASARVTATATGRSAPPFAFETVWDFETSVMAVAFDAERDDDVLVGLTDAVALRGPGTAKRWEVPIEGVGVIADVARRGGVNAFLARDPSTGGPCGGATGEGTSYAVGRVTEGRVDWCVAASGEASGLAVTDAGEVFATSAVADTASTRIAQWSPDGAPMGERVVDFSALYLAPAGDALVVGGVDEAGRSALALLRAGEVSEVPVDGLLVALGERPDGLVGIVTWVDGGFTWATLDVATAAVELVGGPMIVSEQITAFASLHDESIVAAGPYELFVDGVGQPVVASRWTGDGALGHATVACAGYARTPGSWWARGFMAFEVDGLLDGGAPSVVGAGQRTVVVRFTAR